MRRSIGKSARSSPLPLLFPPSPSPSPSPPPLLPGPLPRLLLPAPFSHVSEHPADEEASPSVPTCAVNGTTELEEIKAELVSKSLACARGIFGAKAADRADIHALVDRLETHGSRIKNIGWIQNPCSTDDGLPALAGAWRVVYTTVQILGSKRTKLGLREFVKLGEMTQVRR